MKRGFAVILLTMFGLSLTTVFFIASTQSRSVDLLGSGVNVEATARAVQLQHRRSEIEAAGQERLLMLKRQITQTQQDLDSLNSSAKRQTTQLETQLSALQAQVEESQAEIEITQEKIAQTRQNTQDDETSYQAEITQLKAELTQAESDLATAQADLQTAYDELGKSQLQATALSETAESGPSAQVEDKPDDHPEIDRNSQQEDSPQNDDDDDHKDESEDHKNKSKDNPD